jgi:ketosteroid isomerase-like protein
MNLKLLADDIISSVKEYIEKALSPIDNRLKQLEARPAPEKGEKGDAGVNGKDGADGRSVDLNDVLPLVDKFLADIRIPSDGKDGINGTNGRDGIDGKSVTVEQVREMFLDMYQIHQAQWALDFERRAQDVLQRSIDRIEKPKDGKDGKDGRDGLGVEDFTLSIDGRDVTATIKRGDFVKSHTVRVPALLDRGVFKEGAVYEKGDGVTWGGSFWIAQKDAPEGKPGSSPDWRLAVKAGRDAR